MIYYVLGRKYSRNGCYLWDLDNVQADHRVFDKKLMEEGYIFEYEDEGGYHYEKQLERSMYPDRAWIYKLHVKEEDRY